MVTLPLVRTLPPFRGKIEIVPLLQWLEQEHKDAETFRKNTLNDDDDRAYWIGYGDALTNVLHHLTGMGE